MTAQTSESTRTTQYSPLHLSYDDLSKTVIKIHRLVQKANEGVDCKTATEDLEVNNGAVGIRITGDFSPSAFGGAPEVAYSVDYNYDGCREAPISSVTLGLQDWDRKLTVKGRSADQVQELTGAITEDVTRFQCILAGGRFRIVGFMPLFLVCAASLVIGFGGTIEPAPPVIGRRLGLVFIGFGLCIFLAVLICPWAEWFAGTAVYSGSASFLERHAAEITFLSVIATLLMPVLTGVLGVWYKKRQPGAGTPAAVTTETKPTRRRTK